MSKNSSNSLDKFQIGDQVEVLNNNTAAGVVWRSLGTKNGGNDIIERNIKGHKAIILETPSTNYGQYLIAVAEKKYDFPDMDKLDQYAHFELSEDDLKQYIAPELVNVFKAGDYVIITENNFAANLSHGHSEVYRREITKDIRNFRGLIVNVFNEESQAKKPSVANQYIVYVDLKNEKFPDLGYLDVFNTGQFSMDGKHMILATEARVAEADLNIILNELNIPFSP